MKDHVDKIIAQWRKERPDLDPSPMAVFARVFHLSRMLEQRLEKVFRKHGLSNWAFDVLVALRRAGPPYRQSPTELFSSLLLSSGAMTNRIDRLEQSGLVKRVPDPHDRRSVLVQLTPKGVKLIDAVMPEHLANESAILRKLSTAERKQLTDLLRQLIVSLD
ncbi:MAG TPA: MarR family transcriptional regulator [Planctomycetota bacterium]|nr:MarR family transcriptional regulator [Planctomycetota bacterium]